MNVFLRLMHEGLITAGKEERTINTNDAFARVRRVVPQVLGVLESAFPVRPEHLEGGHRPLAVGPDLVQDLTERFASLSRGELPNVKIEWDRKPARGGLLGTAKLGERAQPFTLILKSFGPYQLVGCISPVGRVGPADRQDLLMASKIPGIRIGAILTSEEHTYDLTVQGDVLLAMGTDTDAIRVGMLIDRVTRAADSLEQEYLPGQDEGLDTFRDDLVKEGGHGR